MQRYTINRDFLENIRQAGGTGKYQEFADAALRGFGMKVTPKRWHYILLPLDQP